LNIYDEGYDEGYDELRFSNVQIIRNKTLHMAVMFLLGQDKMSNTYG
jgi:hypothetical protein